MKRSLSIATLITITLGTVGNLHAASTGPDKLTEFAIIECISNPNQPSFKVWNVSKTSGVPDIPFGQSGMNCADASISLQTAGFSLIETVIKPEFDAVVIMTFGK